MSDLQRTADEFRAALLRREAAAAADLVRAYALARQRLDDDLQVLLARIEQARAAGQEVNADWLRRETRYRELIAQTEIEIARYARYAERRITDGQRAAVEAALRNAPDLIAAALGAPPTGITLSFNRLPREAVEDLVGVLGDGSPLRALLDQLGPQASQAVREALILGLATGEGPVTLARRIRADLGGSAVRALTIARQETLRAYRTASLRTYQANDDVVSGWQWVAARSTRTCAVCWAMHGTIHKLDEVFASHIRCRCAAVPMTRSWAELGYPGVPDTRPTIERGEDLFKRLPDENKLAVLGPGKLAALKAGTIRLSDLVERTASLRWGPGRRERGLQEVLGERMAAD